MDLPGGGPPPWGFQLPERKPCATPALLHVPGIGALVCGASGFLPKEELAHLRDDPVT